ncbi:Acetyltransferase (GNAT) family protein [Pseudonocardia ammonioxydans]|uniref:Acetyltransferase (GNAT) family protein n=1 Tax=Pseudonocardia ammonioxydans TaxID=260086 RepID=A0A1I4V336_PSUAM|nr:GNAT family N-acetyltransferase [Pseudonocardia ammonioxydans]SFM95674.1 Acetyltransferase (GNAT) family protein [Pseudonocardia ammonioxydans]
MLDDLLGRRVTLRFRIAPDGAPGPRFTDAVGELTTADSPDAVVVRTRSGEVRVERDTVVAVREVPPAPARRASRAAVARLERLRSDAWPAPVRRELGGWLLRAAGGYTKRANSTLALGDPGMPVEAALDQVREFADEHGIAPLVQAPVGSPGSNRILEAGWRVADPGECLVLVASLDDVAPAGAPVTDLPDSPPDGWWSVFDEQVPAPGSSARAVVAPGPQATPTGAEVRPGMQSKAAQRQVSGVVRRGEQSKATADPLPRVGFGMIVSESGAAAAVRAAVVEDHVYVSRLHVRPEHRRRGLAGELMGTVLSWGRAAGARHALLDVTADNTAARALYAAAGWTEHHRYHYLVPGAPGGTRG